MLSEYLVKLLSTIITIDSFYLISKIKPGLGFFKSLSASDTLSNLCPAYEIRLLRYQFLNVNITNIKNLLKANFTQIKEAAAFFLLLLTNTPTCDAIKRF